MNLAIKSVVVTVNGVASTLTYNSSAGAYEGTITAPAKSSYNQSGHYYPITITATDEAGNVKTVTATDATLGQALRLVVKEKVKPVSTFVNPASGALLRSVRPAITWKVTDNDSGVNPNTIGITINSGTKITAGITKTAITGGYQCSYTPTADLPQGNNTVKVDATDFDGNVAAQVSRTFVCDTVNPILTVTAPTATLTKVPACTFSGTATDATTAPCSVTIKHNNGGAVSVSVADNGSWSKALTLTEGTNTVVITATDRAGNSTTVTKTIKLDTKAPVFSAVTITPNPVDAGATYKVSVKVTDE